MSIFSRCTVAMLLMAGSLAYAKGFKIQQLPRGKDVTLPRPALTLVPVNERVRLASTDMPQTLKLSSSHLGRGKAATIRVSIYSQGFERVRYLELEPGKPVLYTFREIGAIDVLAKTASGTSSNQYAIAIESDKPLTIAR